MAKASTRIWDMSARDDANWSGWNSSRHAIVSNRLEINLPASTTGYYALSSVETYDLTSSYFSVELAQRTNQDTGSTETIFGARIDPSNLVQMLVTGTNLVMRERVAAVSSDTLLTYNSSTHKFWRIREEAGTVYYDTSPDGFTWTNRRTRVTTLNLSAVTLEVTAGAYNASNTNPGTAIFDNFSMPTPRSFFQFQ